MKDTTQQPSPGQAGPGLGSLTQWVQQRMGADPSHTTATTSPLPTTATTSPLPTTLPNTVVTAAVATTGAVGQRINGLDSDLSEGLESMLPTPAIRYGVTRQRLNQQIGDLQTRIHQIETALPGQDLHAILTPIKTRLSLLQRHEVMVSRHMDYLVSRQSGAVAGGLAVLKASDQVGQWVQTRIVPAVTGVGNAMAGVWQRVLPGDPVQGERAGLSRQLGAVLALIQAMDQGQAITGREDSALRARLINQYETLNVQASQLLKSSK